LRQEIEEKELHVVYTSPRECQNNQVARESGVGVLSSQDKDVVFICGRYERVIDSFFWKVI